MQTPIHTAALLLALAYFAFGTPANAARRATFTLDQVSNGKRALPGPAQIVFAPYEKYASLGAKAPQKLVNAVKKGKKKGSVVANPGLYEEEYNCPITAGGQTLLMDFDTGSSDCWVFSTLMPSMQQQEGSDRHTFYNSSASPHATLLDGYTWTKTYTDNETASGVVYADTVVVGGITATSQAVQAATSVSLGLIEQSNLDGYLGFAFPQLNTVEPKKQSTFYANVQASLAKKLFAADLKHQQPGSYDFGYINRTKFSGPITYTSVNSTQGYWLFNVGGYSIGNSTKLSGTLGQTNADTGSSIVYIPETVVEAYYAQVPNVDYFDGYRLIPCNATLPDFHTGIGGRTFTIPGQFIVYASLGEYCLGGLQSSAGLPFNIFGDIFLKSVYAIFDQTRATPRLGFATKQL